MGWKKILKDMALLTEVEDILRRPLPNLYLEQMKT